MTSIKHQLEKDVQMACCDYLALRRHFFWRTNTVPIFDATKKIFRAMPKYALKGVPDIIVIKDGFFIGLEIKRKGGKQSDEQKEFERRTKESGAEYHLITSVDQLKEIGL